MDCGSRDSLSWEETINWPLKMQGFGLGDEDKVEHTMIGFPFFPLLPKIGPSRKEV